MISTDDLMDSPRFSGAANDVARAGLWLSEQKAQLVDHPSPNMSDKEKNLAFWIKGYPSLEELRATGGPLMTPMETLQKWQGLPKVGYLHGWTKNVLTRLQSDI